MHALFATDRMNTALFVQRLVLATVIFMHGAQKLLGWFGGHGFDATMTSFTQQMGMPPAIAFMVILAETFGMLLLALGLFTRLASFGLASVMLGAIAMIHAKHGFFMNWTGQGTGEGYEYHLLALALAVPLLVWGGGRWALDSEIAERLERPALRVAVVR
jgi:putative oxidoreductase